MLSDMRLLSVWHRNFGLSTLERVRAVAEAAVKDDREDRHTVSDSELAGRIMTLLGHATDPSLEPGSDPLRDRVAQMLASST